MDPSFDPTKYANARRLVDDEFREALDRNDVILYMVRVRISKEISQEALAQTIGIDPERLASIETLDEEPTAEEIRTIADALGIQVNDAKE